MNSLTSHSVVDRMTADLAERRRESIQRTAAYRALARAILCDDQPAMLMQQSFERHPTAIGQTARAA
jgi:hypothetical protein